MGCNSFFVGPLLAKAGEKKRGIAPAAAGKPYKGKSINGKLQARVQRLKNEQKMF